MSTPAPQPADSSLPSQSWRTRLSALRPTLSPEHGVYVVLLVSFLTGAAAAQGWTAETSLALLCAASGFQAEHPLAVQIRQRKTWKPRLVLWGFVYGGTALAIALYLYGHLYWSTGAVLSPLLWIYLGAIAALLYDGFSIWH